MAVPAVASTQLLALIRERSYHAQTLEDLYAARQRGAGNALLGRHLVLSGLRRECGTA